MAIIKLIGVMLISLMLASFAVDTGLHFSIQNQLQTAANAAAHAGAQGLFLSSGATAAQRQDDALADAQELLDENMAKVQVEATPSMEFGFYNFETAQFSDAPTAAAAYTPTGGYNSLRVSLQTDNVPTIFARLFGVQQMRTAAVGAAAMDGAINQVSSGLRPIYTCLQQVEQANADGNPENNVARIYGKQFYLDGNTTFSACPPPGSGNWGFADLRDDAPGAPSASTIADWFEDGYQGPVDTNTFYSTQPGNFLTSSQVKSALNTLIAEHTTVLLPVISTEYSGGGSNTEVKVVSYVAFVFTGYNANGNADSRYIEGYFTRQICNTNCQSSNNNVYGSNVAKIRLINPNSSLIGGA